MAEETRPLEADSDRASTTPGTGQGENNHIHAPLALPESGEADIRTKALIGAILVFVIIVIIAALATWLLVRDWSETGPARTFPSRPLPAAGPVLQISPPEDLAALRAHEDKLLDSTEWVDRKNGIARIPIEQAMTLLIQRSGQPAPAERSR